MNDILAPIDPKTTALLVMDFQPLALGMLDDSESLLARAGEAIRVARARGAHVGYVRVAFDDADYDAVPPHSLFAPLLKTLGKELHSDASATAVHGDIAPQPGDISEEEAGENGHERVRYDFNHGAIVLASVRARRARPCASR